MQDSLDPCPACGGPAKLEIIGHTLIPDWKTVTIKCANDDCESKTNCAIKVSTLTVEWTKRCWNDLWCNWEIKKLKSEIECLKKQQTIETGLERYSYSPRCSELDSPGIELDDEGDYCKYSDVQKLLTQNINTNKKMNTEIRRELLKSIERETKKDVETQRLALYIADLEHALECYGVKYEKES